ncbi:MAG: dephospho-CoA kinase, partial [Bacteroidia bacterium]|nr:dephospho-CoA kinase [Bacteroidia bacterium]
MKRSEPRHRVLRIALTGGIGCGKTEAAHVLRALGAAVWDADESVHRLLRRGTTAYRRIARVFGPDVVRSGGGLCRVALAKA